MVTWCSRGHLSWLPAEPWAAALTEKCLSVRYLWLANGCKCFPAAGNSAEDLRAIVVLPSFVFSW